jgi:hypothetical protein
LGVPVTVRTAASPTQVQQGRWLTPEVRVLLKVLPRLQLGKMEPAGSQRGPTTRGRTTLQVRKLSWTQTGSSRTAPPGTHLSNGGAAQPGTENLNGRPLEPPVSSYPSWPAHPPRPGGPHPVQALPHGTRPGGHANRARLSSCWQLGITLPTAAQSKLHNNHRTGPANQTRVK